MNAPDEADAADVAFSMLIEGARAGHPLAWARLYDRHSGPLVSELAARIPRHLRSRFDAEDLVQATFLKAFRRIGSFEERGARSFETWLTRIARRLLIDEIRHHRMWRRDPRREVAKSGGEDIDFLPAVAQIPSPLARLLEEEQSLRLRAAMRRLPDLDRAVLHLRCEEELSWRDVARRVQHAVHTARRHHDWGLDNLRHEIG